MRLEDLSESKRREVANFAAWGKGYLRHTLRRGGQSAIYQFVLDYMRANPLNPGPVVVNAHRGLGKTHLFMALAMERVLAHPDQDVRFGSAAEKQTIQIALPVLEHVLATCPGGLRPMKKGLTFTVYNPSWMKPGETSRLHLFGCKEGAESQRGLRSDLVILDEAALIEKLAYVQKSILGPQFVGKLHAAPPLFLMGSTPPPSAQHDFTKINIAMASALGRYIKLKGSENPDFSAADKEVQIQLCGGEDTPDYQREIECDETVSDRASLVVPEFPEVKSRIVRTFERPAYAYPVMGVDFGYRDYNAALFGFLWYEKQKLCLVSEHVDRGKTTGELAEAIRRHEEYQFRGMHGSPHPPSALYRNIRRWGDHDLQELHDLRVTYRIPILPANKSDKWEAIAAFRSAVKQERIWIDPSLRHLIAQMEHGIWNEKRTDFERYSDEEFGEWTPIMGHLDALMAGVYLWRMASPILGVDPMPERRFAEPGFRKSPVHWAGTRPTPAGVAPRLAARTGSSKPKPFLHKRGRNKDS